MNKDSRGWPNYVLRGRIRTSTLALVLAFLLVWWLYDVNQPESTSQPKGPETQVVPPGFVPDPNYTWVPRTDVQPRRTYTPTTPTPTPTTPTETTDTTSPTSPTPPTDTTSGSPTTTTPAPPGAPPASPSPAIPGPGPSPTPSR